MLSWSHCWRYTLKNGGLGCRVLGENNIHVRMERQEFASAGFSSRGEGVWYKRSSGMPLSSPLSPSWVCMLHVNIFQLWMLFRVKPSEIWPRNDYEGLPWEVTGFSSAASLTLQSRRVGPLAPFCTCAGWQERLRALPPPSSLAQQWTCRLKKAGVRCTACLLLTGARDYNLPVLLFSLLLFWCSWLAFCSSFAGGFFHK